jgi:hypothetical protein
MQKATGKRIPVELPTDTSFKQLMKMSYNSRLTSIKLEYDQKIEESDRKYRSDIKSTEKRCQNSWNFLKKRGPEPPQPWSWSLISLKS